MKPNINVYYITNTENITANNHMTPKDTKYGLYRNLKKQIIYRIININCSFSLGQHDEILMTAHFMKHKLQHKL